MYKYVLSLFIASLLSLNACKAQNTDSTVVARYNEPGWFLIHRYKLSELARYKYLFPLLEAKSYAQDSLINVMDKELKLQSLQISYYKQMEDLCIVANNKNTADLTALRSQFNSMYADQHRQNRRLRIQNLFICGGAIVLSVSLVTAVFVVKK